MRLGRKQKLLNMQCVELFAFMHLWIEVARTMWGYAPGEVHGPVDALVSCQSKVLLGFDHLNGTRSKSIGKRLIGQGFPKQPIFD